MRNKDMAAWFHETKFAQHDKEIETNYKGIKNITIKPKKAMNSVHEQWAYESNRKLAKFSIVLMIYIFFSNDGIIGKKEEKIIKKTIKKHGQYITHKEFNEIVKLQETKLTTSGLLDYADKEKCTYKTIDKALTNLETQLKKNTDYLDLLSQIRRQYK